ncbi:hypothetical protein BSLG_001940 [Batrachochytrium salamandrivorans]|nr:hypothetical protein BSLG_001940 [Batrachochytrium salamandrivorans]
MLENAITPSIKPRVRAQHSRPRLLCYRHNPLDRQADIGQSTTPRQTALLGLFDIRPYSSSPLSRSTSTYSLPKQSDIKEEPISADTLNERHCPTETTTPVLSWFQGALLSIVAFFLLTRAIWSRNWLVDGYKPTLYGYEAVDEYNVIEASLLCVALAASVIIQICITRRLSETEVKWSSLVGLVVSYFQTFSTIASIITFEYRSHPRPEGLIFSNGLCACILSAVTSTLASVNYTYDMLTPQKIDRGLSQKQRKLVYAAFIVVWYIISGTVGFKYIEGWEFESACQYALAAVLTIGILGFYLLAFEDRVVEHAHRQAKAHLQLIRRTKQRRFAKRGQATKVLFDSRSTGINDHSDVSYSPVTTTALTTSLPTLPLTLSYTNDSIQSDYSVTSVVSTQNGDAPAWSESQIVEYAKVARIALYLLVWWLASAGIFWRLETEWTYSEAVYFCFVTMTGIGFGDLVPRRPWAIEYWYFFILNAVAIVGYMVSMMGDNVAHRFTKLHNKTLSNMDAREQRRRNRARSGMLKLGSVRISTPESLSAARELDNTLSAYSGARLSTDVVVDCGGAIGVDKNLLQMMGSDNNEAFSHDDCSP